MSDAKNVQLSKELRDAINAGTYDMQFQAERRAWPFATVDEITGLKVVVFDGPKAESRQTRTEFLKTYKPTVAVLKKLQAGDDASRMVQSDALQGLVEEIEAELRDNDLADLSFVGFDEEQERDPYGIELFKAQGVFAVAITLEYQG